MRLTPTAVLMAGLLCSCQPRLTIDLTDLESAESSILVFEDVDGSTLAWALDSSGERFPLMEIAGREGRVAALGFSHPISRIGSAGPGVLPPSSGIKIRTHDASDAAWNAVFDDQGDIRSWTPIDPSERPPFTDFLLPSGSWDDCAHFGGCFMPEETELRRQDTNLCTIPCAEPVPPTPPAVPRFPCQEGWVATPSGVDGIDVCKPVHVGQSACPDGQYRIFGKTTCESIITNECPAGKWPATSPANAVYVEARNCNGPCGGDGTMQAPFGTIRDALDLIDMRGQPGAILLSAGNHREGNLDPGPPVQVIGLCPERTKIDAMGVHAIEVNDRRVELRDLSFIGGGRGLVVRGAQSHVVVRNVTHVAREDRHAMDIDGGRVDVDGFVSQPEPGVRFTTREIDVHDAHVTLRRVALEGDGGTAVRFERCQAELEEVIIEGRNRTRGSRIQFLGGTTLGAERVQIVGGPGRGFDVLDAMQFSLRDVSAVRFTPVTEDHFDPGIKAIGTADVSIERAYVDSWGNSSIEVCRFSTCSSTASDPVQLRLEDTYVRNSGDANVFTGMAVRVSNAEVTAKRVAAFDIAMSGMNFRCGVDANCAPHTFEDLLISVTLPITAEALRFGVWINGAVSSVDRLHVRGVKGVGIQMDSRGFITGTNRLHDARITDTDSQGVLVHSQTSVDLQRVAVSRAGGRGLDIQMEALGVLGSAQTLQLHDLLVEGTKPADIITRRSSMSARLEGVEAFYLTARILAGLSLTNFSVGPPSADTTSSLGFYCDLTLLPEQIPTVSDGRIVGFQDGLDFTGDLVSVERVLQRVNVSAANVAVRVND